MVLDGGGQIAGNYLTGIVIHGQGHDVLGVVFPVIAYVAHHGDGMGDHGGFQGVFHVVFRHGVAHQAPALNEFHAVDVGKKMMFHMRSP